MTACKKIGSVMLMTLLVMTALIQGAAASEIDLNIPMLDVSYNIWGYATTGSQLLLYGMGICVLGMLFGFYEFVKIKGMPAHKLMLNVSETIYETCKTYMKQQAKLLVLLEVFIAACIFYYFFYLNATPLPKVLTILGWSILGILGSFSVAWFGMRINTYANSRTAFDSLKAKPFSVMSLPLRSGMSIGVLLICVELIMMIAILLFVDRESAGACFVGFAIGESLGASALRICGGIFTKIADIGADLMKIIFKIDEDDARNPGVIADCTGDNAGDSVGPTADGFETYGVTGVALISFIVLAAGMMYAPNGDLTLMAGGIDIQARLIVWIFAMRVLMIITSVVSYLINNKASKMIFGNRAAFNFETPLTSLIWLTSILSILVTFGVSYVMIGDMGADLWWKLSVIISCGTLAAALIPEFTKIFTSSKSKHVDEIVNASREAGASLNIISGIVAGNFSAFWQGMVMVGLMVIAFFTARTGLDAYMVYPTVFAFGLVAFGMLGMGPVTIAVDSYGPVTDNAQSVFELSQIEGVKGIDKEIEKEYGFKPNFEQGKQLLEENDSAGNTFKATAKPVLIGTAVKICTIYAQKGMLNIFIVIFSFTIAFACFNATLFASYLISIAVFGLFQALYMANAGGAWDNAKKVVEVDLHEKGSALHAAAVVGDTVGDPYKDTSSVALNPIIKFTTLFGLLAVEMAVAAPRCVSVGLGVAFFLIGLYFVYRSFYGMRIEPKKVD